MAVMDYKESKYSGLFKFIWHEICPAETSGIHSVTIIMREREDR